MEAGNIQPQPVLTAAVLCLCYASCCVQGWQYNAEALRAALASIPTAYQTVEAVEKAVKDVCAEHGTRLARFTSKKGQRGHLTLIGLRCVHGMRNRQGERREKTPGELYLTKKLRRGLTAVGRGDIRVALSERHDNRRSLNVAQIFKAKEDLIPSPSPDFSVTLCFFRVKIPPLFFTCCIWSFGWFVPWQRADVSA